MRSTEFIQPTDLSGRWARRFVTGIAILVLTLAGSGVVVAQNSPLGRGVRLHDGRGIRVLESSLAHSASTERFEQFPADQTQASYGIMGAVAYSGVYLSSDMNLRLAELVEFAGGLTERAMANANVVRNGRGGLQMVYSGASNDRLLPGDIVVFEEMQRRPPGNGLQAVGYEADVTDSNRPQTIDVALVGLDPNQAIIVNLDTRAASVSKIVAALHQHPDVARGVRVIRTSHSALPIAFGQQPRMLTGGDVLVFDASQISFDALAQADPLPSAIPIDIPLGAEPVDGPSIVGNTPDESQESMSSPVRAPLANSLPSPIATFHQTTSDTGNIIEEPARSFEELQLPALELPPADQKSTLADAQRLPESAIRPTTLIEEALPFTRASAGRVQRTTGPTGSDFAANSYDRLAMLTTPDSSDGRSTSDDDNGGLSTVPAPIDLPDQESVANMKSRATTLGLMVLAIAIVCFLGSLIWSKLDESTGVAEPVVAGASPASAPVENLKRTPILDGLIANSVPLIEEATNLPHPTAYHGEAVGRRRIRVDARQELRGPHFAAAAAQSPGQRAENSAIALGSEQQLRHDAAGEIPIARSTSKEKSHQATQAGGLLDRVLVAMEREKQR